MEVHGRAVYLNTHLLMPVLYDNIIWPHFSFGTAATLRQNEISWWCPVDLCPIFVRHAYHFELLLYTHTIIWISVQRWVASFCATLSHTTPWLIIQNETKGNQSPNALSGVEIYTSCRRIYISCWCVWRKMEHDKRNYLLIIIFGQRTSSFFCYINSGTNNKTGISSWGSYEWLLIMKR